jgi:hypothetical protein
MKNMINDNKLVKQDIYDFFEQNHQDQWIKELCTTSCILISEHGYVSADKVFWAEPGFGVFRHRLSDEMRKYANFLSLLGVKDTPDYQDALSVLTEVSEKFTTANLTIDEETRKVFHHCWSLLQEAPSAVLQNLFDTPVVLTNSNRLEKPRNIYFDDFPGIAEELGLAQRAIARPTSIWQPMHESGVKFLSEAVKISLVDAENPVDDPNLKEKLSWGRDCILRVVETARQDSEYLYETGHLNSLKFIKTDKISIRYSIPELPNCESEIIPAPAFYENETKTIYYEISATLNNISREIARSISNQPDLGLLASGIKEILGANSLNDAIRNLNDLGFAVIEISKDEQASSATVSSFGEISEEAEDEFVTGEEDSDEYVDKEIEEEITPSPSGASGNEEGLARRFGANLGRETSANKTGEGELPLPVQTNNGQNSGRSPQRTSHSAGGNRQGGERHKSTAPLPGRSPESQPAQKKPATNLPKAKGRLRSYLESNSSGQEARSENREKSQFQLKTSAAGVQKVLDFEEAHGRDPYEMGHSNQGYDIKSMKDGKIVRFIEVKSTDGAWDLEGVKLTVDQYQRCIDEGDRFWLYVVEWANDPEKANIYCIQNPAAQVTDYCFDGGWKSLDKK